MIMSQVSVQSKKHDSRNSNNNKAQENFQS